MQAVQQFFIIAIALSCVTGWAMLVRPSNPTLMTLFKLSLVLVAVAVFLNGGLSLGGGEGSH